VNLSDGDRDPRDTASRIADLADDVAATLDQVADTRERLASDPTNPLDAEQTRRHAQRARNGAEGERRESAQIRDDWDLPPRR
jgi:hypothetical protein